MKKFLYLLVALAVFLLDQWTKLLVVRKLPLGARDSITSWFSLVNWRNAGGLFGMLDRLGPAWRMGIFLVLPLCGLSILVFLFVRSIRAWELLLLSAILGGAAGNLLDRVRLGSVTDFLYFHLPGGPGWPAFNVADAFLSTSIIVYLALYLFGPKTEQSGASGPLHNR